MYQKTKLKNGIRLISAPIKETKTADLLVLVKVGSRQETKSISGISHFIEHLMFKGTTRRPNTLSLSKELDGIGAEYNAFTGKDFTGYYIKADTRHLSLAIDVLSDMLLHSKFDNEELEREKGVIVEEINMYEDNPLMYVDSLLEQLIYGSNDPLGRMIAGSRESVKGIKQKNILDYKNNFYNGKNTVIALSGAYQKSHLKEIEKKFNFVAGQGESKIQKLTINQKQPQFKVHFKETEQVQVALGFPSYAYTNPKIFALQLMSIILGGNMSSRLFVEVRERNGLAYFVRSSVNTYQDTGNLTIQAGLDKSRIEQAVKLILSELKKIKEGGVNTEELQRSKDYLAGRLAIDWEDSSYVSQFYASQELFLKKILTPEERLKKIMSVTQKQIKEVAGEIFDFNRLNLAVIGPFKDDKIFRKIIQ
ncbi:MAG: pitrilysin family protein [bacterium]